MFAVRHTFRPIFPTSSVLPVALHFPVFVRAHVDGKHVFIRRVVSALLPPCAVRPTLPPPLPPLLVLSAAPQGAQVLYGRPRVLPQQGGAHQNGPI